MCKKSEKGVMWMGGMRVELLVATRDVENGKQREETREGRKEERGGRRDGRGKGKKIREREEDKRKGRR
jgi:hypothetical protein